MRKNYLFTIMATAVVGAVIASNATQFAATSILTYSEEILAVEDSANENNQWVRPEFPTPEFTELVADGQTIYYLYNVEAKGFLVGANRYGTHASVSKDHGYAMRFEVAEDGCYRLMDQVGSSPIVENGAWSALDCDNNLDSWVDGKDRQGDGLWTITPNDDKTFTHNIVIGFL